MFGGGFGEFGMGGAEMENPGGTDALMALWLGEYGVVAWLVECGVAPWLGGCVAVQWLVVGECGAAPWLEGCGAALVVGGYFELSFVTEADCEFL